MSPNASPAEPATFEDLYIAHAARVVRLLARLGVPAVDCDDAAQEVWIAVHGARPSFDPRRGSERAWIGGFACNVARNWRRTQRRRPDLATLTDAAEQDLAAPPIAESVAAEAQRDEALRVFLEQAISNPEQHMAFVLHEIEGMTIGEVAEVTGVKPRTARGRIEMARSKVKKALGELTEDERERMRAAVLPLGSVDEIIRALRDRVPELSDERIAETWDRVVERIEAMGGSVHEPMGAPAAPPAAAAPKQYAFTSGQIAGGIAGLLLVGALLGAGVLYALLTPREKGSFTAIEHEIPAPRPSPTPAPQPAPSASAAPSTLSSSTHVPVVPWESEAWLLDHARTAAPLEALRLTTKHARLYPQAGTSVEREEIAIRALLKLGRRADAERRAARLVTWAPAKARAMETLFGRSFL